MGKLFRRMLLTASVLMIAWSLYTGVSLGKDYAKGRDSYRDAEDTYVSKEADISPAPEETPRKKKKQKLKAPITVDFNSLRLKNPDVVGWIYIESIELSYPVMQGKDNEYYLTHTWDRQEVFAASIFMDYRNYPDFKDFNTIIYGHNMKDGTMFHNIQYCMEPEHYEKSPYIWILTPDGDYKYEIFSEYDTRYDSDTYTIFDGPGESLEEYIRKMQEQSLWKTEIKLGKKEHILTLSTCNGADDLRRIVQARRIAR